MKESRSPLFSTHTVFSNTPKTSEYGRVRYTVQRTIISDRNLPTNFAEEAFVRVIFQGAHNPVGHPE